jgi:hypothetical protein
MVRIWARAGRDAYKHIQGKWLVVEALTWFI